MDELEMEGEERVSDTLDGSLIDGLAESSAAALARWRLWRRFLQWMAK